MKDRNNRSMSGKTRMNMLNENYELFLSGKITGAEFNKFVSIHLIDNNGSGGSNNKAFCNCSK